MRLSALCSAATEDEYVDKAVALAGDIPRLAVLSAGLREPHEGFQPDGLRAYGETRPGLQGNVDEVLHNAMNTEYMPLSRLHTGICASNRGTLFFVQDQAVLPVSIAEAPRAALDLPLGFVRGVTGIGMVGDLFPGSRAGTIFCLTKACGWAVMCPPPWPAIRSRLSRGQEPGQIVVGVYLASNWLRGRKASFLFD